MRNITDQCHYELPTKTAKEQLVREIRTLQERVEALTRKKKDLEDTDVRNQQIIALLTEDDCRIESIKQLKCGESHKAISTWLQNPAGEAFQPISLAEERKLSTAIENLDRDSAGNADPFYWTSATDMPSLVEQLVAVYLE